MTFEEFQNKVKRNNTFDRCWNYFICISIILLGVFFIYSAITKAEKFSNPFIYFSIIFCWSLGGYGLYILPNRYKIIIVEDPAPLDIKKIVVQKTIKELGKPILKVEPYTNFEIRKGFWSSSFEVHMFFDQDCYAFSLQRSPDSDGGFIDFGKSEEKREWIENTLSTARFLNPVS